MWPNPFFVKTNAKLLLRERISQSFCSTFVILKRFQTKTIAQSGHPASSLSSRLACSVTPRDYRDARFLSVKRLGQRKVGEHKNGKRQNGEQIQARAGSETSAETAAFATDQTGEEDVADVAAVAVAVDVGIDDVADVEVDDVDVVVVAKVDNEASEKNLRR
jgi:hypothetical protein